MGGWNLKASIWQNPFSIKDCGGSADLACRRFEKYIRGKPDLLARLPELRGKRLGCWCKNKGWEACHGDVLVKLVREYDGGRQGLGFAKEKQSEPPSSSSLSSTAEEKE
jgi:hypothetical protein